MLGQTKDSGSSNNTMAQELEIMFSKGKNVIDWDSSQNDVRCYANKQGLAVKKGLKILGLFASHIKPTTPANISVPVPTIILHDDMSKTKIDHNKSDNGDDFINDPADFGTRHEKAGENDKEDNPTYKDIPTNGFIVVEGTLKV